MARVKRGVTSKKRHSKVLERTKGFRGTKSKLIKVAREAELHAGNYAYHGRKLRKRDFRQLWIVRINEAVKEMGYSYSVFIKGLKDKKIELDRKTLSNLVNEDPETFKQIVNKAMENPK